MPTRENVLNIYCSDGRSRKPNEMRGKINNAIRLPGGLLFPDLCANSLLGGEQTFEMSAPIDIEIKKRINRLMLTITPETGLAIGELILLIAYDAMVQLKKPTRTNLWPHTHCGAADRLGLDDASALRVYATRGEMLLRCHPDIPVEVMHDHHCESGETHYGHVKVPIAA